MRRHVQRRLALRIADEGVEAGAIAGVFGVAAAQMGIGGQAGQVDGARFVEQGREIGQAVGADDHLVGGAPVGAGREGGQFFALRQLGDQQGADAVIMLHFMPEPAGRAVQHRMMELRQMLDQEFQLEVAIAFARLVGAADEAGREFRQDPGHVLGSRRGSGDQKAQQDRPDDSRHRDQVARDESSRKSSGSYQRPVASK